MINKRPVLKILSIIWILVWGVYFILAIFDIMGQHWFYYIVLFVIGIFLFIISVVKLIQSKIKKQRETKSLMSTVVIYAIGIVLYYLLLQIVIAGHIG